MGKLLSALPVLLFCAITMLLYSGCKGGQEIDLENNEAHKRQAFNQLLNNPELQDEFLMNLRNDRDAMKRMMKNKEFTGEFFRQENMNYIWDQNPGMDTTVIDNLATRLYNDTVFLNKFNQRMQKDIQPGIP